jgi:hypothetical protein
VKEREESIMVEDHVQARPVTEVQNRRWLLDLEFWFDRATWSAYMTFVLLSGMVLLILLPNSQRLSEILPTPPDRILFPAFFVILYGILAITLGQAEIEWQERLRWPRSLFHLLARQLFVLALALPYWLIFLLAHSLHLGMSLPILLHTGIYGSVLGLFGWRLALTRRSEIYQFNLKYLLFTLYLLGSFFLPGLNYLNPLWQLDRFLGESPASHWIGLAVQSYLLWAAVAFALVFWIRRCLIRDAEERGSHGVEISGP